MSPGDGSRRSSRALRTLQCGNVAGVPRAGPQGVGRAAAQQPASAPSGESEREEILVSACVGLLFLFKCRGVLGLVEHHLVFKSWSQRG